MNLYARPKTYALALVALIGTTGANQLQASEGQIQATPVLVQTQGGDSLIPNKEALSRAILQVYPEQPLPISFLASSKRSPAHFYEVQAPDTQTASWLASRLPALSGIASVSLGELAIDAVSAESGAAINELDLFREIKKLAQDSDESRRNTLTLPSVNLTWCPELIQTALDETSASHSMLLLNHAGFKQCDSQRFVSGLTQEEVHSLVAVLGLNQIANTYEQEATLRAQSKQTSSSPSGSNDDTQLRTQAVESKPVSASELGFSRIDNAFFFDPAAQGPQPNQPTQFGSGEQVLVSEDAQGIVVFLNTENVDFFVRVQGIPLSSQSFTSADYVFRLNSNRVISFSSTETNTVNPDEPANPVEVVGGLQSEDPAGSTSLWGLLALTMLCGLRRIRSSVAK